MSNIILLGITSLLTDISSEMVYPILPVYLVSVLGASPAILGLIEGIAESLASLLKVFSGYFSDKIKKRRPFAIIGYAGSTAGKIFLYFSSSWAYVLVGRVIDRFGKGIRTAPRDALIAENSGKKRHGAAFGLHRAMDSAGATIGVILAYFLVTRFSHDAGFNREFNQFAGSDNLRKIFLFSLIPAFLGLMFLFFVKEKNNNPISESGKIKLCWHALDSRLKLFLIFTFIFALGNSSNQFLLLRAKNIGSTLPRVILLYFVYNIVNALVTYPATHLSDKIGRRKLLVWGHLLFSLVYFWFAFNNSLGALWVLFGIYGLYSGFTEGVEKAFVADLAHPQLRATAIGLHATLVGIGLFFASLFAGLLWKFFGATAPFYFGGLMGIVASAGFWFLLKDA